MKKNLILAALCPLLTGCWATRIVTVTPDYYHPASYTTTVTVPKTHTMTTATRVIAAREDICLSLDLQAVGAAFAQSSNVQEFENLLNDSSYMLSNLDLNGDGYVDYLRVLETVDGYNHVFLIQAVLGENIYQDVASVIAELPTVSTAYVQVIGAPYIYGPNYILRPVFLTTPRIYTYLMRPSYVPWHSPWYWGHYPTCYHRPAPLYVTHYQAYVHTYMNNHRYCHEVRYDNSTHYTQYNVININIQRNDYGQQHPERSFETRTTAAVNSRTATAVKSNVPVNARDIIEKNKETTTTTATTTGRNAAAARKVNVTATATAQPATTATATRKPAQTAAQTTTAVKEAQPTQSQSVKPSTTVKSRVRTSGTSTTKISTTSPSTNRVTTVKRGSASAAPAKSTAVKAAPAKASATARSSSTPTRSASSSAKRIQTVNNKQ